MPPPRAQAAFPPPPRGAARVAISHGDRPLGFGVKRHHKRKGTIAHKHLVVVVGVVVVVVGDVGGGVVDVVLFVVLLFQTRP